MMDRIQSRDEIEIPEGALGIITDIHGNADALGQVLGHGRGQGVERWLVLGDVVAMGPEPGRVLDQLAEVDVVAFVAGNTERYVLTGDRPAPSLEEVAAAPSQLPRLVEVAASFAWTKGYLQARGALDQLRAYRSRVWLRFPDRTRALAVHASQVADDGPGIAPGVEAETMAALFPKPDATLVFGGHTHRAVDVTFDGVRFVNPGSVSNHDRPELGACYSILRIEGRGHDLEQHKIEHHDLEYDKQLTIDSILDSGIPGSGFLLRRYFDTDTDPDSR